MDSNLKQRLIRIAAIGRQLIEGEHDRDFVSMLEGWGKELCDLSGVCEVCGGSGIHPGEDPEGFDGETPLARCPCCIGAGITAPPSDKLEPPKDIATIPKHLAGLADAAFKVAESGGDPTDLLKMLEHGLKKSQPKM